VSSAEQSEHGAEFKSAERGDIRGQHGTQGAERGAIRGKRGASSVERGAIRDRCERRVRRPEISGQSTRRKVLEAAISAASAGHSVQNTEKSVLSAERQVSSEEQSKRGAKCKVLEPATRRSLPVRGRKVRTAQGNAPVKRRGMLNVSTDSLTRSQRVPQKITASRRNPGGKVENVG